jgi:glycosyltransferase involved in cell wall biosynthesis
MTDTRKKVLWIGDAVVASGFAKVTHYILDAFEKNDWDIYVLGLNHLGDPHQYSYPIYPAFIGGDSFGLKRTKELTTKIKPDVIIIQNDPWNIPGYTKQLKGVPIIATMPVDGKNCKGSDLNGIKHAIFWTQFGADEAQAGGYNGSYDIIPLGVDLHIYRPGDRTMARKLAGLPHRLEDAYIVGNINRNQPRKRLDLTIAYFAEWIKSFDIRNAYLFLHVAPTGDKGYDVQQLAGYYGIGNRIILAEPEIGFGVKEAQLVNTYQCFDVQITTTQGEGWGLTTMEGMASGIPQIVPAWAALGEWCKDAATLVDCSTIAMTPNNINVVGGVVDKDQMITALNILYYDEEERENLKTKGLNLVQQDKYRWENIGKQFEKSVCESLTLEAVIHGV